MKRYFLVAIILAILLTACGNESVPEESGYTIDTPYEYPVSPENDKEAWDKLNSVSEKIAVCAVPDELLREMTTRALVETVLEYPLMANIMAFESFSDGFIYILSYCNALQELVNRDDAVDELENAVQALKSMHKSRIRTTLTHVLLAEMRNYQEIPGKLP